LAGWADEDESGRRVDVPKLMNKKEVKKLKEK